MNKLLLLLIVAITIVSCKQKTGLQKFSFKGETMGSYYSITYFAESELVKQAEVDSFLAVFNKSLSTWDKNSLITAINNAEDKHVTDSFFRQLYRKSKEVNHFSGGIFDPTGMPLFEAWGFGLKNADKMDSARVDSILRYVGIDKCYLAGDTLHKVQKGVRFSFDALAPGYAADLIAEMFVKKGITSFLIDIGGEFMAMGKKDDGTNWKVGIEKPVENKEGPNALQAFITMGEKEALATSGNYRKFYYENGKKYSHTINVKSGYPVTHNLLSATILAGDAVTADAYATACMAMGLENAKKFIAEREVKAYFIYDENGEFKEFVSDNLKQQFGK